MNPLLVPGIIAAVLFEVLFWSLQWRLMRFRKRLSQLESYSYSYLEESV